MQAMPSYSAACRAAYGRDIRCGMFSEPVYVQIIAQQTRARDNQGRCMEDQERKREEESHHCMSQDRRGRGATPENI